MTAEATTATIKGASELFRRAWDVARSVDARALPPLAEAHAGVDGGQIAPQLAREGDFSSRALTELMRGDVFARSDGPRWANQTVVTAIGQNMGWSAGISYCTSKYAIIFYYFCFIFSCMSSYCTSKDGPCALFFSIY